jgi:lipopolysaccharide/colanic/teichoic acid biosynthesis glycosyltransferase
VSLTLGDLLSTSEGELSSNVVIASVGSEPGKPEVVVRSSLSLVEERVSAWSHSGLKRAFDVLSVLLSLPLLIPAFIVIGFAVRLTSKGPVLFLQKRTGMHRRNFTILKFRTMEHLESGARNKVTTAGNQRFTPVGPFLRRWKLDELPQVLNVLIGDMTLVGPRPKLAEHQLGDLKCRPGITGAATIAFAREEQILALLAHRDVDDYYHSVILPAKLRLDRQYTAQCTFLSDLKLILDTVLRRWDSSALYRSLEIEPIEAQIRAPKLKAQSLTASMTSDGSLASGD